jgi:hypothetical protein
VRCLPFELERMEPNLPGRRIRMGAWVLQRPILGVQWGGTVRIAAEWRCRSVAAASMAVPSKMRAVVSRDAANPANSSRKLFESLLPSEGRAAINH